MTDFNNNQKLFPAFNMSSLTALYILFSENSIIDESIKLINKHKKRNDPAWSHLDWLGGERWINFIKTKDPLPSFDYVCRQASSVFIEQNPFLKKISRQRTGGTNIIFVA